MDHELTRREFLEKTGVGAAALAAGGIGWEFVRGLQAADAEEASTTADGARLVPTTCLQCDGGCALVVKTVNGNAIKVDGNPLSPLNRGKSCLKAQAALQSLYDPDRLPGPRERTGERGSGQWRPLSWEAALERVGEKLSELRASGHPERLLFLQGRSRGQMDTVIDRFCRS